MKKITTIFLGLGVLISIFINIYTMFRIGGINYFYLPFPIKVTTCGSSYNAAHYCSYPYILWGIIASILFWILILIIPYLINKK